MLCFPFQARKESNGFHSYCKKFRTKESIESLNTRRSKTWTHFYVTPDYLPLSFKFNASTAHLIKGFITILRTHFLKPKRNDTMQRVIQASLEGFLKGLLSPFPCFKSIRVHKSMKPGQKGSGKTTEPLLIF